MTAETDNVEKTTEETQLDKKLEDIKHTFVVLSGKGGVGKSTVAINLAASLALRGYRTGLLDVDVHGPSVPKLLGLSGKMLGTHNNEIVPIECFGKLNVVSMGLLIGNDDQPIVWRGPLKYNVIKEFLEHVMWGKLDYLVIDSPPGTGDEPLSVAQLIKQKNSAIIVTTPQQVATIDVAKCITFCNQLNLPITGVIENMSGFICPHCGKEVDIFSSGGGEELARKHSVPFLGRVPLDPEIVQSGDAGKPYVLFYSESKTAKIFDGMIDRIINQSPVLKNIDTAEVAVKEDKDVAVKEQGGSMKFAVPTSQGKLCAHFGHCEAFALLETDSNGNILSETMVEAPEHQPGLLPPWLAERGVKCVIAGGMGSRAQQIFMQNGITVVTGAQGVYPREIVEEYLKGTLETGANTCDH